MVRRLGVLAATVLVAAAVVTSAHAALFFLFEPTTADVGDSVTVRLGGTSPSFTLTDREKPFDRPIRLYLVPNEVAPDVRSRFDPRLHFIGALVPDRNSRGVLPFRVPPLDTAKYAVAAWCPGCARSSRGRSFFELGVTEFTESRFPAMVLRVRMPDPRASCPVTKGRHGNGFLSVTLPDDGVLTMQREPDGTLFDKLGWIPKKGWGGSLKVRGERLDAPGRMRVLNVFWGHTYVNGVQGRGSWMTPVELPSEGCWRMTGRVGDIALSFVVQVVAAR
jgi:hypothetical protein